jgi:hypothetical protein
LDTAYPPVAHLTDRMTRIDALARDTSNPWFLYRDIAAIHEQVDGDLDQLILELQDRAELLLLWAGHEEQHERLDTATHFHQSAQAYAIVAACLLDVR